MRRVVHIVPLVPVEGMLQISEDDRLSWGIKIAMAGLLSLSPSLAFASSSVIELDSRLGETAQWLGLHLQGGWRPLSP